MFGIHFYSPFFYWDDINVINFCELFFTKNEWPVICQCTLGVIFENNLDVFHIVYQHCIAIKMFQNLPSQSIHYNTFCLPFMSKCMNMVKGFLTFCELLHSSKHYTSLKVWQRIVHSTHSENNKQNLLCAFHPYWWYYKYLTGWHHYHTIHNVFIWSHHTQYHLYTIHNVNWKSYAFTVTKKWDALIKTHCYSF